MEERVIKNERFFARRDFPVVLRHWKGVGSFGDTSFLYRHDEIELQFIYQGDGVCFIGPNSYRFRKNSVIIVHGNEPHVFVKESGLLTEKVCVLFSPKVLIERQPAMETLDRLKGTNHLVLPDKLSTLARVILSQMMEECMSREMHWREMVTAFLEALLITLDRCSVYATTAPDEDHPFIRSVVDYLQEHSAEQLSLVGIAERFSITPEALSRVFRQKTGVGFRQYLIRCRIADAKRLLEQTEWKTAKIAHEVGFNDISTFNRDFRLITGVRPSDYRKLCR